VTGYTRYGTIRCGALDSATESRAHGRLMGVSGARATGPRVRDGMSGCGARRGDDFAMAGALSPGRTRVFTCQCVAAQLGSPQDAPSWSGLPKQLGHARPRAHMLAEASFPRRYPGRASPVRSLSGGPSRGRSPLPGHPLSAIEGARAHEVGDGAV
jgi:hypothetical protein